MFDDQHIEGDIALHRTYIFVVNAPLAADIIGADYMIPDELAPCTAGVEVMSDDENGIGVAITNRIIDDGMIARNVAGG